MASLFFGASGLEKNRTIVRPPGALVEEEFLSLCIRCNQCVDACPTEGLRPAGFGEGISNIGTPTLATYCMVFEGLKDPSPERTVHDVGELCLLCTDVCPTGALQRVEAKDVDLGTAVVERDRCLGWIDGSCSKCVETCPILALYVEEGGGPVLRENRCWGCGQCVVVCPVDPWAIYITPEGAKRVGAET